MPRFAANLSMLWPHLPTPIARLGAAEAAGFEAVEILFVHDLDPREFAAALAQRQLRLVLFDAYPGDWAAGERGLLCHRDEDAFEASVDDAVRHAGELGTGLINILGGLLPEGLAPEAAQRIAHERLRWVTETYADAPVCFVVEAINPVDMPGYLLPTLAAAAALVRAVDRPNLRLQFDAYHVGMTGQEPETAWREVADLVAHVQLADVPGRHEPGTGTLDLTGFLAALDDSGYSGWVGLEYHPLDPSAAVAASW